MPTLLIECGIEGLALRKGDGLRVDLDAGTVHVFRDDDAPALLRGQIPARLTWREAPSPGQQWKCGDEDSSAALGVGGTDGC